MKIGIIGATGKAGREIYLEAVRRGEDAVALVRSAAKAREILGADVEVVEKDAFDLSAEDIAGFDVIVNAFATAPDQAHRHIDLTRQLVEAANEDSPRLLFILGAGSLTNPATGRPFVEDLRKIPEAEAFINIPEQQFKQLEYLRTVDNVNWVGISPQADFPAQGPATTPQLGTDSLLTAADGKSHTTAGTMAVAVLDELQRPAHHNTRFTVSDS
ncbi:NAD(P)-dependent oxidoreductase [Corynebacterium comes]|uniref:NAD(P)-binding domain-containing protein n=1 Tax=Corynebacterium comes TaxID=2675218 RepID=A0A6B8VYP8_9CORY|nr:NAD(P)H-binding protein [Corynebacterium comes]QGU04175.1 hypothetical protein CETAM_04520 [Corynebacterium comes]